ncbi:MAG: SUMF1/EgtB/PvdO family nonheme iron enzyme [Thermoguttaceae bacterium]|nr:SUMF1/EgtB/PvdO family nonheme iron enzyme [Thermoguttaceae bacterium]
MSKKSGKVGKRIGRNAQIAISAIIILLSLAFVFRPISPEPDAPVAPPMSADEAIEWHAFLVATNHYDVRIRNLTHAESDVDDLKRSLITLGFKEKNITVLKSSNTEFSLGTSKEAIEDAYQAFLSKLTERSAAFVYLAGHGFCQSNWLGRPRSYYAPSDFQFGKIGAKRVSIDKMMKQLAKSKARFKWMCVDACREPLDRGISSGKLSITSVPPGIVLTQSCELGQQSFEAGKGEGAPFENGLFTRALVDAIEGRAPEVDADRDNVLTLGELCDYIVARVPQDARRYNRAEQNPVFSSASKESFNELAKCALFRDLPIMGRRPEVWRQGQKLREEAEALAAQENYADALKKINQAYRLLYDVDEIVQLKKEIEKSFGKIEAQTSIQKAEEELQAQRFSEAADYLARALEFDPGNQAYELFQERLEAERNAYVQELALLDSFDSPLLEAGESIVVKIAGIDVRFRWCPPGEFMMGCSPSEDDSYAGELFHKVKLTQGFWIAETETTQALWNATMGFERNPSDNQGNNLPVERVNWNDCQEFIERIQSYAPDGMEFQLPTEAQWEYACRAGTSTQYSFGDEWDPDKANNGESTTAAGSFEYANPWGIKDMHGNVREWIKDWIGAYSEEATTDPSGPKEGTRHVLRGGCALSEPYKCFSGIRFSFPPEANAWDLGFRLVLNKKLFESPYAPGELRVVSIEGVDVSFRWCPPGVFRMGSPASAEDRDDDETQHKVVITKGFWLAETEATQELWKAVMGRYSNPSRFKGDNLPVEMVSWNDCQDFINKLNEKTKDKGFRFRLPSEAHWEYACRAGSKTAYWWGDDPEDGKGKANVADASTKKKNPDWICFSFDDGYVETSPVGVFTGNAWGLKDMHGNVWEWCSDWYGVYPMGTATDPTGPGSGSDRVVRGGGWILPARGCRTADRHRFSPENQGDCLGFRLELEDVIEKQTATSSPNQAMSIAIALPKLQTPSTPEETPFGRSAGDSLMVTINDVEVVFCWCPPGEFMMGSPANEESRDDDETRHKVVITKGFWLAETEATQALWKAVMGEGNNPSSKTDDNLPVENVSWNACQEFIKKLNDAVKDEGLCFSLPSEAHWEYACRAGTTTRYSWGNEWDSSKANNGSSTTPVGSYSANAWGLKDMHGNVWELCQDWYDDYPTGTITDPTGSQSGSVRVNRGGGWGNGAGDCRSADRGWSAPGGRDGNLGFRLECDDFSSN